MDSRIEKLTAALKASGYESKIDWNVEWSKRRGFDFEDVAKTILQIIAGNVYVRVVVYGGANGPLLCLKYVSTECPDRPKTAYHKDPNPAPAQMSLEEVFAMIPGLEIPELAKDAA